MKNIKNKVNYEIAENGEVFLTSENNETNAKKIEKIFNKKTCADLEELHNVFFNVSKKKMEKSHPLKTARYFARKKRAALKKLQAELNAELVTEYVNDYLALTEEYLATDNQEIANIINKIKANISGVVNNIEQRKFNSLSELSSGLDEPVLNAIDADILFSEIEDGYLFLTGAPEIALAKEQLNVVNNMFHECENKHLAVNSEIEFHLQKPNLALSKHANETVDLFAVRKKVSSGLTK